MLGCEGVKVGFGCVDIFRGYRLNQNTKPFMCIWGHWDCVFEPKSSISYLINLKVHWNIELIEGKATLRKRNKNGST